MRGNVAAEGRGWQNRAVERERDPQRVRWLWLALLAMAAALSPTALYLVQNNLYVKTIYEANATRDRVEALEKVERTLLVEKERLESEARIEAWALRQRELHRPPEGSVIVVEIADDDPAELLAHVPEVGGDPNGVH